MSTVLQDGDARIPKGRVREQGMTFSALFLASLLLPSTNVLSVGQFVVAMRNTCIWTGRRIDIGDDTWHAPYQRKGSW